MAHRAQKLIYWLPTILWMIVIYSFSAQPSLHASPVAWQDFYIRKSAHIGEYVVLASLCFYSITKTTRLPLLKRLIFTGVLALIYACSDEFHQSFVFDRTGKIVDVFIDFSGILLSLILWARLPLKRPIEK